MKFSKKLILFTVSGILSFLVNADVSLAIDEGIEIWGIRFRPVFRLQEQYDSNVFLDEKDEKDDWITNIYAGTDAELKLGDVLLTAGYISDINLFADEEHENQNNYNHTVKGLLDWKLTDYEVIIKDTYKRFSNRAGSEDTARVSRQNNVLSTDVLAAFDKLTFDLGYDFIIEDYLSNDLISGSLTYDDTEDRFYNIFRGETGYRFLPKTSVLIESDFGLVDYDNSYNSDSYFIQALTGLRGDVPFLTDATAEAKFGFRFQDYDKRGNRDFIGLVSQSALTKNFGAKDAVTLRIERSVNESTYRGLNYYVLNHFGLGYRHLFTEKLSVNLNGYYQFNRYPEKTTENGVTKRRVDHFYTGECSLTYDIQKWFSTELKYSYMQRESRFADFDYADHVISVGGKFQF